MLMGQKISTINREISAQQHKCATLSAKGEGAFGNYRGDFITLKKREESRIWESEWQLKLRKLEAHKPRLPKEINGIPLSDEKQKDPVVPLLWRLWS